MLWKGACSAQTRPELSVFGLQTSGCWRFNRFWPIILVLGGRESPGGFDQVGWCMVEWNFLFGWSFSFLMYPRFPALYPNSNISDKSCSKFHFSSQGKSTPKVLILVPSCQNFPGVIKFKSSTKCPVFLFYWRSLKLFPSSFYGRSMR